MYLIVLTCTSFHGIGRGFLRVTCHIPSLSPPSSLPPSSPQVPHSPSLPTARRALSPPCCVPSPTCLSPTSTSLTTSSSTCKKRSSPAIPVVYRRSSTRSFSSFTWRRTFRAPAVTPAPRPIRPSTGSVSTSTSSKPMATQSAIITSRLCDRSTA